VVLTPSIWKTGLIHVVTFWSGLQVFMFTSGHHLIEDFDDTPSLSGTSYLIVEGSDLFLGQNTWQERRSSEMDVLSLA